MTTYGPKNPQDINAPGWVNPNNAKVADGNPAEASVGGGSFPQLNATKYTFGVPPGDYPNSLTFKVRRKASAAGVRDDIVRLVVGGALYGPEKASPAEWAADWEEVTYTWSPSPLTREQVNSDVFGLRIVVRKNGGGTAVAFVDGVSGQVN